MQNITKLQSSNLNKLTANIASNHKAQKTKQNYRVIIKKVKKQIWTKDIVCNTFKTEQLNKIIMK